MIKAALIACFVAVALAAPAPEEILSYDAVDHKHEQTGQAGEAVKGSYSFTDPEGRTLTINYVADENGYRAEGEHLPVAPEVPAVPEPVAADPAPVEEAPAAEAPAADPAPVEEAPAAEAPAAVETPASTATLITPTLRYVAAAPYAAYPYAAPYAAYPYAAPYGFGYSYGYPFFG